MSFIQSQTKKSKQKGAKCQPLSMLQRLPFSDTELCIQLQITSVLGKEDRNDRYSEHQSTQVNNIIKVMESLEHKVW